MESVIFAGAVSNLDEMPLILANHILEFLRIDF